MPRFAASSYLSAVRRRASPLRSPESTPLPANTAFLLLDVAGTPCALARASVAEILPLPVLHAPPAAGGPLAGFLNLGGAPVPVIDLARLLGLKGGSDARDGHLVLAADRSSAFLVDRAEDLVVVADVDIRPVSEARTLNGCVVAEIARGGRLVHVLDLARLLTEEERLRLEALTQAAAERLGALAGALADAPADA